MIVLSIGTVVAVVLLTSLFKNTNWNPRWKAAVATVLSVLAGVVIIVTARGSWSAVYSTDFMTSVLAVFGSSQLVYKFILAGTVVEDKLANVNLFKGNSE